SRVLAWNFDGTNLTVRGTRSDSSAYLSTNTVNFHWEAKF
ncbi:MAG: hypothetical protein JWO98_2255, partial [Frankiales bacterium]|nr:hypothetical protein [Frankiales bacterium]